MCSIIIDSFSIDSTPVVCNTRRCNTPGCMYPDFHTGCHSFEITGGAQKRPRTCNTSVEKHDQHTLCEGYDSIAKQGHRISVIEALKRCKNKRILYLDDGLGSFTKCALNHGIEASHLVPVNKKLDAAKSIEHLTGVKCILGDICDVGNGAELEEYGVIWYDMCGVDFGRYSVSDLVHGAEYKFYTLSSRSIVCSKQLEELCMALSGCGEKITQRGLYTGRSENSMNMVFVSSKRNTRINVCKVIHDTPPAVGTVVRFPISYWKDTNFIHTYGYKVYDGEFLVGAIHSVCSNSPNNVRLTFNTVCGSSMLCSMMYSYKLVEKFFY